MYYYEIQTNKNNCSPCDICCFLFVEKRSQAHYCACDLSSSLHPDWLFDLPRRAYSSVSESGEMVIPGVLVFCGHHSHHCWLWRLCTWYSHKHSTTTKYNKY